MREAPKAHGLQPVPLKQVKIDDGFWSPKQAANREHGLPHQLRQCEETGRRNNLARAGQKMHGGFEGYMFNDSDVYKWLEAASHSLATHADPELEKKVDDVIDVVAPAQEPDGYINSYFAIERPDGKWRNLGMMHELYCIGHLIEAGVAHLEATGKRSLLDVAVRAADLVCGVFGPGKREGIPGHEEIELALVALHGVTGDRKYLEQAKLFIDRRGKRPSVFEEELKDTDPDFPGNKESYHFMFTRDGKYDGGYVQDHMPLLEQKEVVGHAVRAMYLFAGATDVARDTGDALLIGAIGRLWDNLTTKRMYITGGIGPTAHNEGFTRDYDLPNDTAYAETCAALGLIFWAHRMALLHGESRFVDVMETAMYNGALSGISLDGTGFFYVNPLESDGTHRRRPWFGCACCPPNIARFIASLGKYVYATSDHSLWVNLYGGGEAIAEVPGVGMARIRQETDYPWSGDVRITIEPQSPGEFAINLRKPRWCEGASAYVGGTTVDQPIDNGYLCIRRKWSSGDVIELSMPMQVRCIQAHPAVRQDAGRIALGRGPIVYCFEGIDNPAPPHTISILPGTEWATAYEPDLLGGVVTLRGDALADDTGKWEGVLYRDAQCAKRPVTVTAIPYYAWANRDPSPMAVWMRAG